ncbi:MAG TPA: TRAP transporter small permease subunit [Xanthobacteraceae bacterium]
MLSLVRRLGAWHDRLTTAGFAVAATLVALIAAAFCYEVIARYAFFAPTEWSYAVASYFLCSVIFLSMPELTRRKAHIAVSYLLDGLSAAGAEWLRAMILLLAALACLVTAAITGQETWRQYAQGISTISAFPVPKWWVSIFVPYGTFSSAVYFFRQFVHNLPSLIAKEGASS